MNENIKKILEKCNEQYSNGLLYRLTGEDVLNISEDLLLDLEEDEVTDEIYDILYYTAKSKYPTDLFFTKLTSNNTGYGEEIVHETPMGSMDELKAGDWEKWSKGHKKFVLSDKLDGCSIILTYENGELKTAATRGRGLKGKDIMRHVKLIESIKKIIPYKDKVIIRGELLFKKVMIDWLIGEVKETTGKVYKNGRNMIAGLLNSKEASYDLANANFIAYWTSLYFGNSFEFLNEQGFEVAYNHEVYRNWEEKDSEGNVIQKELTDADLISMVKTRLANSNYELDGVILTQLDNIEEGFETGTINPKASRKFKIGIYNNIAESVVTNIKWQVSKFGVFTPVIEIEPKEVSGCTVTNITAHNYKNLITKKCGIGSKVKFCRAGLVIPHLMQVLTPSENYNLPNVKTRTEGVDLILNDYDLNEYSCETFIQSMVDFGRKLDIDQMGYGNCATIFWECMKGNLVLDAFEFLGLPKGLVSDILGKNGEKLEASLKVKKTTSTEAQVCAALSVFGKGIGETVLNKVYSKYNTLFVTEEQLNALEDFGDVRITQYLNRIESWKTIRELLIKVGWVFKEPKNKDVSGPIVCFSGIRDKQFAAYLEENGGIATDSWKSSVTHLVVKDKNGNSSKIKKALEKNIPILTLDEAKVLFGKK